MSQHLINDFIHRSTIFKPLKGEKIVNKKLVKYQASNRNNNTSPQDIEESVYDIKTDKFNSLLEVTVDIESKNELIKKNKENNEDSDNVEDKHIDIIV